MWTSQVKKRSRFDVHFPTIVDQASQVEDFSDSVENSNDWAKEDIEVNDIPHEYNERFVAS